MPWYFQGLNGSLRWNDLTERLSKNFNRFLYDLREQHPNCRVQETSTALNEILDMLDIETPEKSHTKWELFEFSSVIRSRHAHAFFLPFLYGCWGVVGLTDGNNPFNHDKAISMWQYLLVQAFITCEYIGYCGWFYDSLTMILLSRLHFIYRPLYLIDPLATQGIK